MCKWRTFFEIRAVGKGHACEGNNKHSRLTNNKLQEESHTSSIISRAEVMPPPADSSVHLRRMRRGCGPERGGWVPSLGALAWSDTLCPNSRHASCEPAHCSRPPRRGSAACFWTHLTNWLPSRKLDANRRRDVMPPRPRLLPAGRRLLRFSCSSTFNFHPSWRCTSKRYRRTAILQPGEEKCRKRLLSQSDGTNLHHRRHLSPLNFIHRSR